MKLYLAGPMTGIKDLNFPAFHAEAARLRALGHEVINPAEINSDPNAKWLDCMRADIQQLVTCDSVAMLDGWTASKGARLEHHIALELGLAPRLAAFFVDQVAAAQRECNAPDCTWKGATDRMCGSVGPLCPECGETTESVEAPAEACVEA